MLNFWIQFGFYDHVFIWWTKVFGKGVTYQQIRYRYLVWPERNAYQSNKDNGGNLVATICDNNHMRVV